MDPRRRQFLEGQAGQMAGATTADFLKTMSGEYLQGSPYQQEVIDRSLMDIQSRVGGTFGNSGRYGSGQWSASLADAMAGTSAKYRDANYQAERDRMMEMGLRAPAYMATGEYIGAAFEEDAGLQAEEAYRQYRGTQDRLQDYLSAVYGSPMAQNPRVDTTTKKHNNWVDILGMVLSPNIGSMIGGGK
jgi:hypothetical protein